MHNLPKDCMALPHVRRIESFPTRHLFLMQQDDFESPSASRHDWKLNIVEHDDRIKEVEMRCQRKIIGKADQWV